jgi:hypothetical protein
MMEHAMAQRNRAFSRAGLSLTHPNAAGIDIGSASHFVAVPPDRDEQSVREFASFTADLERLANWLTECGVDTVAMESTGVYWIPLFELLDARGFRVLLVNARHVKNVSGRKSDVLDCQWIQHLHELGLLRGSFRPVADIVELRTYVRHRQTLVESAAREVQHMQKALLLMNLQIHHAVNDLTGATGMRIVRAIVAGETNPSVLAKHRDPRCRATQAQLEAALRGNYKLEHLFVLEQSLVLYDAFQSGIAACGDRIERKLAELASRVDDAAVDVPQAASTDQSVAASPATKAKKGTKNQQLLQVAPLLVTIAVVAVFVTFAAALAWADRQTSAGRPDSGAKRRSS